MLAILELAISPVFRALIIWCVVCVCVCVRVRTCVYVCVRVRVCVCICTYSLEDKLYEPHKIYQLLGLLSGMSNTRNTDVLYRINYWGRDCPYRL